MKKIMIATLMCAMLLLSACTNKEIVQEVASSSSAEFVFFGFLTTDGSGCSSKPFQLHGEYSVEWEVRPEWTALPIYVVGDLDGEVIKSASTKGYQYTVGTTPVADAYYTMITEGYQQTFEDTFTEIYNKLNDIEPDSPIDATGIADILSFVSTKEEYGDMRDILTDAVVLIKDYNEGGDEEALNEQALYIYTRMYSWLSNFSTSDLVKN